jgi:hypothetical protein
MVVINSNTVAMRGEYYILGLIVHHGLGPGSVGFTSAAIKLMAADVNSVQ